MCRSSVPKSATAKCSPAPAFGRITSLGSYSRHRTRRSPRTMLDAGQKSIATRTFITSSESLSQPALRDLTHFPIQRLGEYVRFIAIDCDSCHIRARWHAIQRLQRMRHAMQHLLQHQLRQRRKAPIEAADGRFRRKEVLGE